MSDGVKEILEESRLNRKRAEQHKGELEKMKLVEEQKNSQKGRAHGQ